MRVDYTKGILTDGAVFVGKFELPKIGYTEYIPEKTISFCKALKEKDKNKWIHFFIHDYKFERVWNNPSQYLNLLKSYRGVITTDFSLYLNMPRAEQIWNVYRNRCLAYWFQKNGINIIPCVSWSDVKSYDFCFDGIESFGSVAISINGCLKNKISRNYFQHGLEAMVDRLKPKNIINCGPTPQDIFKKYLDASINIIQIDNHYQSIKKAGK